MDKLVIKSKKGVFTAEQYDTCATHFYLWKSGRVAGTVRYRLASSEYSVELDDIKNYTLSDWKELYPVLADLLYELKRNGVVPLAK